eukprot:3131412-Rhodomonas_salina.1
MARWISTPGSTSASCSTTRGPRARMCGSCSTRACSAWHTSGEPPVLMDRVRKSTRVGKEETFP